MRFLLLAATASAQTTAYTTPWYLSAVSDGYMGSMKAFLADPSSTASSCYEKALIVKQALDEMFASNNAGVWLNSFQ